MEVCVLCRDVITNPVCADCLEVEITTWLNEVRSDLVDEFRSISNDFKLNTFDSSKCVICGNSMSICAYCYTEHILSWLLDKIQDTDLIREFMQFFNFDLEHQGYEKQLKIGGFKW